MRIRRPRHGNPESAGGTATIANASPSASIDDRGAITGYRVVRRLGSGGLADVYLGVSAASRSPVALKIFRPEAPGAGIEREYRVLTESAGGRFAELVDVATLIDGRICFVQEHLPGIRLSRMLGEGCLLDPGEAVTILAPITAALMELLDLGYLHDGPGQASVLIDRRGRPVLTGLGRLRDLPPPGPERRRAMQAAADRFSTFALGVLDRVERPHSDPLAPDPASWLAVATPGTPFRGLLDEFEHRLFGWAAAEAVRVEHRARPPGVTSRWDASGSVRGMLLRVGAAWPGERSDPRERLRWHPDHRLATRALDRLAVALRARRRPLLVFGLVGAAFAVLLLTLMEPSESTGRATNTPNAVGVPSATATRGVGPTPRASSGPAARDSSSDSSPSAPPVAVATAGDRVATEGDDPVRAVPVLLRRRAGCLVAASVPCLDEVDQAGSVALAADTEAVRAAQQSGPETSFGNDVEPATPSLLERSGNVALVGVVLNGGESRKHKPASVLVVKGEAGWRIRQIFDF